MTDLSEKVTDFKTMINMSLLFYLEFIKLTVLSWILAFNKYTNLGPVFLQ